MVSSGEGHEKFMLSLSADSYLQVKSKAQERGITVQEMLRAVIVPDWMKWSKYIDEALKLIIPDKTVKQSREVPRAPWEN